MYLNASIKMLENVAVFNPIRSGGGGGALKASPPIFCPHAFNFGATLLCVGVFSPKNSLTQYGKKNLIGGSRFSCKGGFKIYS